MRPECKSEQGFQRIPCSKEVWKLFCRWCMKSSNHHLPTPVRQVAVHTCACWTQTKEEAAGAQLDLCSQMMGRPAFLWGSRHWCFWLLKLLLLRYCLKCKHVISVNEDINQQKILAWRVLTCSDQGGQLCSFKTGDVAVGRRQLKRDSPPSCKM